jgi:UDP:flavonoid glycosyltransferase YjiC (YdhE family)
MGRTVVIFAAGSRGDLQPAVALGRGLAARGDSVRIIASKRYELLITAAGLEFFPLSLDPAEIASSPEGQELLAGGRTLFFVSHNEKDLRRFCKRGLYLDKGKLVLDAPIGEVLERYNADYGA